MRTLVALGVAVVLGLGRGCGCSMFVFGSAGRTWAGGGRALCSRSSGSRLDVGRPAGCWYERRAREAGMGMTHCRDRVA
jgi:hypothetical protein